MTVRGLCIDNVQHMYEWRSDHAFTMYALACISMCHASLCLVYASTTQGLCDDSNWIMSAWINPTDYNLYYDNKHMNVNDDFQ